MLKKILVSGYCTLFAVNAFAFEDLYAPVVPQVWSSIITLSGGPAWANPGRSQTFFPFTPPVSYDYSVNSNSDILGTGELFFGLQNFIGASNIVGQLGLGVAGAGSANISGMININGVPDVNTYQYKVNHLRVELKGKLIADGTRIAQPYLSASVGAAWNYAYDYLTTTVNPVLYPVDWYTTYTTVSFTYTLGVGIQRMLTPHWQVGVGYEFADLGENKLGSDSGGTINNGPSMPHLYTNELLFSLSYIF